MKHIHLESATWWYELAWRGGSQPAFVLRIETWALVEAMKLIRARKQKLFEQDNPKVRIGGGGAFFERTSDRDRDFATFRIRLPRIRAHRTYDWETGERFVRTMSDMLNLVSVADGEPNLAAPQLLTAEVYDAGRERPMHRFPLGGRASAEFKSWARAQGQVRQEIAEKAMHEAWTAMIGSWDRSDFRCWTNEDGSFHADVPGNCACIGTEPESMRDLPGYEFGSHNVDNPWQQLSLLAGIAALWQRAKKETAQKAPETS